MTDHNFRRRDMLEAERIAGEPFSKLFREEEDGEQVATALGSLAMQYVLERRNGETDLGWEDWLDEDADGVEVEEKEKPDPS